MKTPPRPPSRFGRSGRLGRSRHRYDHRWWGEPPAEPDDPGGYWRATRRPLPCLVFVLPLLLLYEVGLTWAGGGAGDALRAGADSWLRHALRLAGLTDRWLPPLALTMGLLAWQSFDRRDWRFHPLVLGGMIVESLVLALGLIALSRLVDLGFTRLDHRALAVPAAPPGAAALVGLLGAGIYEEALFRLVSIPLLYRGLRLAHVPELVAATMAISASSLAFSLAHHAGAPGEAFTLFAFVFRWLAGVFFAYVFVARGFGVAVGTHSAYDLLVGYCEVSF